MKQREKRFKEMFLGPWPITRRAMADLVKQIGLLEPPREAKRGKGSRLRSVWKEPRAVAVSLLYSAAARGQDLPQQRGDGLSTLTCPRLDPPGRAQGGHFFEFPLNGGGPGSQPLNLGITPINVRTAFFCVCPSTVCPAWSISLCGNWKCLD